MVRKVCMGNEAIALGALAAGLKLAAGYPGTPSTEIIETLVRERRAGVGVQWSVNEKAALEVAAGGDLVRESPRLRPVVAGGSLRNDSDGLRLLRKI